jgi:hypothetical protein
MIDRLVHIEVIRGGMQISQTFHRVIPDVRRGAIMLHFEPDLPSYSEADTLSFTWHDQTVLIPLAEWPGEDETTSLQDA